jgi:ribonuclease R
MVEPLPRREAILDLLASRERALAAREIAARLHVAEPAYPGFLRLLENLAQEGVIRPVGHERYALDAPVGRRAGKSAEREGTLTADPRGFGFVKTVGFSDDLYIPEHAMGGALHGDRVIARPVRRTALGSEGEVLRVVSRGQLRVAGVLRKRGKSAWLEPDDARVRGPVVIRGEVGGHEGEAAVVVITRYPELLDENPEGELLVALGAPGDPNVEVAKILIREAIEAEPPDDAKREADAYGDEVPQAALAGRVDLTHVPLPTIDPEDARDHDDAVWVERDAEGFYTAWVAIADVSDYVRPGTALDAAACARGCSIYLPDRALPMLPPALSSNLCSLLPDKLRLCLCAIIRLDPGANVLETKLVEGIMKSRAKLHYPGVARALGFTQKPEVQPAAEEMVADLRVADQLSQMLRTKRLRRGALDFQLPEPKVVLDKKTGAPIGIERRADDPGVRRAYQLIEELMLLANEVVAKFLVERQFGAIFRVHPPPDEQKIERFAALAEEVGLPFETTDAADPKKLSLFLRKVANHPKADVLNMLLLRSLKQASYDVANIGHFGLASAAYLHFTSPIRRYPDLVVHRIVKSILRADAAGRRAAAPAEEELQQAAQLASERERKAMEVEREVVDLYRALYMRNHIGETFEGTVTGLVGSGAFVALDSPYADVMVRVEAMGRDGYELDDDRMRFVGKRSGDSIALGDRMVVTIEDVSILRRMVYAWRHAPDMADRAPLRHTLQDSDKPPRRKPAADKGPAVAARKKGAHTSARPTGHASHGTKATAHKKKGKKKK